MEDLKFRDAIVEDIGGLLKLSKKFYKEGLYKHGYTFNSSSTKSSLLGFIEKGVCVVATNGGVVGVCLGLVTGSILDEEDLVGQEFMWYVDDEHRGSLVGPKLLKLFESRCKDKGAKKLCMIHMSNILSDKVKRFYDKCGFSLMEQHYIKEVE